LLGLAAGVSLIVLVGWLSWMVPSRATGFALSWIELLRPFLPLLAVLLLFGALSLFLSLLLPSARFASMLSGALVVGNYLVIGLSNMNDALQPLVKVTPLYYVQGGEAIAGLRWDWLAGLLGLTLLCGLAAWGLFLRRDIRVGGERSWRLPRVWQRLRRGRAMT
jgi:hypothetical protein